MVHFPPFPERVPPTGPIFSIFFFSIPQRPKENWPSAPTQSLNSLPLPHTQALGLFLGAFTTSQASPRYPMIPFSSPLNRFSQGISTPPTQASVKEIPIFFYDRSSPILPYHHSARLTFQLRKRILLLFRTRSCPIYLPPPPAFFLWFREDSCGLSNPLSALSPFISCPGRPEHVPSTARSCPFSSRLTLPVVTPSLFPRSSRDPHLHKLS